MKLKNVKNLKIYHDNHFSFKNIKEESFFKILEEIKLEKQKILIFTALVELIRSIGSNDKYTLPQISKLTTLQLNLAEANFKEKIADALKIKLINGFCNEYISGNYIDMFRGEITEYISMQLYKSSASRVLHEPRFKHKKKILAPKNVKGDGSLVDIVKIIRVYNEIHLYECKADLNKFIKKKKTPKFINKLDYMDYLENKLPSYSFDKSTPIRVHKYFISLNSPTKNLPNKYRNYTKVDLLTQLRTGKNAI